MLFPSCGDSTPPEPEPPDAFVCEPEPFEAERKYAGPCLLTGLPYVERLILEYDASERLTSLTLDDGIDGVPVRASNYFYDAADNLTRIEFHDDTDRPADVSSEIHYGYDAAGVREYEESHRVHLGGDYDSRRDYFYGPNGLVSYEEWDKEIDGVIDSRKTYTYDENDVLLSDSLDYGDDGTIEVKNTYFYNDAGLVSREETDMQDDGSLDYIRTNTYDGFGNWLTHSQDNGANGTISICVLLHYDCWL